MEGRGRLRNAKWVLSDDLAEVGAGDWPVVHA